MISESKATLEEYIEKERKAQKDIIDKIDKEREDKIKVLEAKVKLLEKENKELKEEIVEADKDLEGID